MTVGFVGIGRKGSCVLAAGFALQAFDRSRDVMRETVAAGVQPAATADTATSDVMITVLSDAEAVDAAVEGVDGIAAGFRSGAVVVEWKRGWISMREMCQTSVGCTSRCSA